MYALFKRLRRDERGATAVEFALVAPILFILTLGVIEAGALLTASSALEAAVHEGARAGITGFAPDGVTRAAYVENTIRQHAGSFLDSSQIQISAQVFNSFAEMQSNPTGGTSGYGGSGQIVLYTVSFNWQFLSGYGAQIFSVPSVNLQSSLAVRNEPF